MKSNDIKRNVDNFLKTIKECEFAIAELRDICPHNEVYEKDNKKHCIDCKIELPKEFNSELYYGEVKYSTICTQCINKSCDCTFANTIVKQYFPHK